MKRQNNRMNTMISEKCSHMLEHPMHPLCRKVRGGDDQQESIFLLFLIMPNPNRLSGSEEKVYVPDTDPFRQAEALAAMAYVASRYVDNDVRNYRVGMQDCGAFEKGKEE
jgi:hypothetical protein